MLDILLTLGSCDIVAYFFTKLYMTEYSQKCRWFLLHALCNLYIMYYSYSNLVICLRNPLYCSITPWDDNSTRAFLMCTFLHLYHCFFFQLSKDDIIHHGMMLFIAGPITYRVNTISSISSLFFLSGLPGFIDYSLLWLFKCFKLNNKIRKYIFVMVNLLIRSPGCLLIAYINVLNYTIESLILTIIIYWNSQFYLNQAYESYYKII